MARPKVINVEDVIVNEDLYPRHKVQWFTSFQYSKAMEAGNEFPPILVAKVKDELILVDGAHRLEAYKLNKTARCKAFIKNRMSERDIFIEAIRANNHHGQMFSQQDRARLIRRLQDLKLNPMQIAGLVGIPVGDMKKFVGGRLTNTVSGKEVVLKGQYKHLKGRPVPEDFNDFQEGQAGWNQQYILRQVVGLVSNGLYDEKDNEVMGLLRQLKRELRTVKLGR